MRIPANIIKHKTYQLLKLFDVDNDIAKNVTQLCIKKEYDNALENLYANGWEVVLIGKCSLALRKSNGYINGKEKN